MRERIQERSLKALEGRFPLEDDFYRLEASNFRLDPKRSRFGIQDVKNAILRGETLRTPVQADLALIDKSTNKVLDTKKGKTLAAVPYLTHRNTFVMRGTEYIVANQERLKPGVYTRLRNNGLLEAHGNVRPGTGKKFKMHMDPATGVFSLDLDKSKIRLYGVLKALGVSDEEMRREWGEEIWKINSDPKQADKARLKAWEKLGGPKYGQPDPTPRLASAEIPEMQEEEQDSPEFPELAGGEQKEASDNLLTPPEPKKPQAQDLVSSPGDNKDPDYDSYLREVFGRMEFDPEVSWRNLGKAYNQGGGGLLLDTSSKLLNISRGQAEPDDQSALYNKTFHTPDDFFEERVSRDAGRLSKALLFRLRKKPSLDSIPSGWFTPQLEGVVLTLLRGASVLPGATICSLPVSGGIGSPGVPVSR